MDRYVDSFRPFCGGGSSQSSSSYALGLASADLICNSMASIGASYQKKRRFYVTQDGVLQQDQRLPMETSQLGQQEPGTSVNSWKKRRLDNGTCARRLMQYMYHQRQRPQVSSILYWRKFVAEYFALQAKKRWCFSLYDIDNVFDVFPQLSLGAWQCDICGSKHGKGFEATCEVLPRLFQTKFDHGVVDETMLLDAPHEYWLSSGNMVLKYEKAVQETVYEHLRIVRKGQLRIVFTPELKILSWEFCSRQHEEFLSRRLLAPQVKQLFQVAKKYQAAVIENNSSAVPKHDFQAICNMFAAKSCQLARNLELQSMDELGFSKRYIWCLKVSEVVNIMKDLIDFSQEQKIGAIESLKNYPRCTSAKLQKQKIDEADNNKRGVNGAAQQSLVPSNANANLTVGNAIGGEITGTTARISNGSVRNELKLQNLPSNIHKSGNSFTSAATANIPSINYNSLDSRPGSPEDMDFSNIDQISQQFAENGFFDWDFC
ncbi:putative transcriptional regulator SLK2 [Canna indica]|uniref:Transcriptional regulator SLK2 n=1 Tax=Canna indica TaxID=4628 RepID=A0AAQ3QD78_9LILI|nr:putative transcriptional regulator SLK2 [Canna indica]